MLGRSSHRMNVGRSRMTANKCNSVAILRDRDANMRDHVHVHVRHKHCIIFYMLRLMHCIPCTTHSHNQWVYTLAGIFLHLACYSLNDMLAQDNIHFVSVEVFLVPLPYFHHFFWHLVTVCKWKTILKRLRNRHVICPWTSVIRHSGQGRWVVASQLPTLPGR